MAPRTDSGISANPFPARYDSDCPECFEAVKVGDHVAFVDNEIVCEACWEEARDAL